MKKPSEMSRAEFAAHICDFLMKHGVRTTLSGGSCVSIYCEERYVSFDLDFVQNEVFSSRKKIAGLMEQLGFTEKNRYFEFPGVAWIVEFPPGPLAIGEQWISAIHEMRTEVGVLRLLRPTDCVKDRLAWFFHDGDMQCLEQALLVSERRDVDIEEIRLWSCCEKREKEFGVFLGHLKERQSR